MLYKVFLQIKPEEKLYLENCCKTYHKIFNKALEVQFKKMSYGLSYDKQLMSIEELVEKVKEDTESLKIDNGIIHRASEASQSHFKKWWFNRLNNSLIPLIPPSMKARDYFKTSTILKVSKGGFLYLPKFKRIKFREGNRVPVGSYKNVKVICERDKWYALLESVEELKRTYTLNGTLDVYVDAKGNLFFRDKVFPNIVESKSYVEASKKLKSHLKQLKRKAKVNSFVNGKGSSSVLFSKQMKSTKDCIEKAYFKMKNVRKSYFQQIVNSILKERPEVLTLTFDTKVNEKQSFTSYFFKKSGTLGLLRMISQKVRSTGATVQYLNNIKEETFKILNS